jgi:O-antigen ligase
MFGEIQDYYVGVPIFRGYGLSSNPNNLGGFILTGLYGGILFLNRRRQHEYWLAFLVAAGGLVAGLGLLATMSRSAIGALVVTLGLVVVVFPPLLARHSLSPGSPEQAAADRVDNSSVLPPTVPAGAQRAKATIPIAEITFSFVLPALIVAIPALLALTAGMAIFGPSLAARFMELTDPQVILERVFGTYSHTIAIIQQHPLLGVGANNLMLAISKLPVEFVTRPLPAHNVYLALWAELGIPGPPLFLLAVGQIVTQLRRRDGIRLFIAGVGVLAWCLIMLVDYYPWGDPRSRLMFFLTMGLWWGYRLRTEQQQS